MAQNEQFQIGETCTWRGFSGRSYKFNVYDVDAPTLQRDGVYIFAAAGDLFTAYAPLYIGAADNFASQLPQCRARMAALALGATTLHIYYGNAGALDRNAVQQDLLERYRPALNGSSIELEPEPSNRRGEVIPFPSRPRKRT